MSIVICKPHLLYGAEVFAWTRSELACIRSALNCKIYKVQFDLLEAIYSYTGPSDIADIIMSRHSKFLASLQCVVVRHLVSTML